MGGSVIRVTDLARSNKIYENQIDTAACSGVPGTTSYDGQLSKMSSAKSRCAPAAAPHLNGPAAGDFGPIRASRAGFRCRHLRLQPDKEKGRPPDQVGRP